MPVAAGDILDSAEFHPLFASSPFRTKPRASAAARSSIPMPAVRWDTGVTVTSA